MKSVFVKIYAPRNSKKNPRLQINYPCNPCNPCSEPYASRINNESRVLTKDPCSLTLRITGLGVLIRGHLTINHRSTRTPFVCPGTGSPLRYCPVSPGDPLSSLAGTSCAGYTATLSPSASVARSSCCRGTRSRPVRPRSRYLCCTYYNNYSVLQPPEASGAASLCHPFSRRSDTPHPAGSSPGGPAGASPAYSSRCTSYPSNAAPGTSRLR